MYKIFVDLEMQPVTEQSARKLCRNEIIEIGAVSLGPDLNETGSYKTYVKPEYSKRITNNITYLTGITNNKLTAASSFKDAVNDFALWCAETGNEYQIYSWSDTDRTQIIEELHGKGIHPSDELGKILASWNDFQKDFDRLMDSRNPISLKHALEISGIPFEGKMHDALYDARNTAKLYKAVSDPARYREMLKAMRFYADKEEPEITLGDLFDFGSLFKTVS